MQHTNISCGHIGEKIIIYRLPFLGELVILIVAAERKTMKERNPGITCLYFYPRAKFYFY